MDNLKLIIRKAAIASENVFLKLQCAIEIADNGYKKDITKLISNAEALRDAISFLDKEISKG